MNERTVNTRIVRIGNSQGVRIPKLLLEQSGLEGDVRLRVVSDGIVIERAVTPRAGWGEAARTLAADGEGERLDSPIPTAFDEEEWVWE